MHIRTVKVSFSEDRETLAQMLGLARLHSVSGAAPSDRVTMPAFEAEVIPPQVSHSGRGTQRDVWKEAMQ